MCVCVTTMLQKTNGIKCLIGYIFIYNRCKNLLVARKLFTRLAAN